MSTLTEIETLTAQFAVEHGHLAGQIRALEVEIQNVKHKRLSAISAAVERAAKAKLVLHQAIAASPALFEKPRTQIFHGVKVGLQKGKGGIEYEDADRVVVLLRRMYGDNASAFIRTKEEPDKKMLADMPVAELKKLGCIVTDSGDQVVIKPTDSEIEKTVAALLKDAVEGVGA